MAKRKRQNTAQSIQKRLSQGRGEGHGADYLPWLNTQDVPSLGRRSRIWGWKCGRFHRLLSDLETAYFFVLEWSPMVSDIREQFPLLPRTHTRDIAEQGGLRHPADPRTSELVVMTTDFLVTVARPNGTGSGLNQARSTKYASDLGSLHTMGKLEIERRFWVERGVDWGLVTEREIPDAVVQNVKWLYNSIGPNNVEHPDLTADVLRRVDEVLRPRVQAGREPINALAGWCDDRLDLRAGTSLAAVRHFLGGRRWQVDMFRRIDLSKPLELLDALDYDFSTESDAIEPECLDRVA